MKFDNFFLLLILMVIFFHHESDCQKPVSDFELIKNVKFHNDTYNARHRHFLTSDNNKKYNPFRIIAGSLMYFYQNVISDQLSSSCMYSPSCSEFSKQLMVRFGLINGVFFTADRLMRCSRLSAVDIDDEKFNNPQNRVLEKTDIYLIDSK